jgi:hypothetical protein
MIDIDTLLDRIMSAMLIGMGVTLVGLPLAIAALG